MSVDRARILSIEPTSSGSRLTSRVFLPQTLETLFPFFADAFNLEALTPAFLSFKIVTPAPIVMREGALIDYSLKLHGLPLKWQSRIAVWQPGVKFVDEQLRGPYRSWWHLHRFEELDGGTIVIDEVDYRVWGGAIIDRLFVRPDLKKIFTYRQETLLQKFAPA